ncbi:MAG: response regulator [Lentisphaeraceae bacterium]|nr:response regulator [Lentisphaeraceae bacterium]
MYVVIEDCDTTRQLLTALIGMTTKTDVLDYSSAEGFIRDLKVNSYDLDAIFVDINLPGITGIELIENFQKIPSCASIPIVVCSASNDKRVILQSIKAGAKNFIIKPFTRDQVTSVLESLPKREKAPEPEPVAEPEVESTQDDQDELINAAQDMAK